MTLKFSKQPIGRADGRMHTYERNGDKSEIGAVFYHSHYHHAEELMKVVGLNKTKVNILGDIKFKLKDDSYYQMDTEAKIPYMKPLGMGGNLKLLKFMLKEIVFKKQDPLNKIINAIAITLIITEGILLLASIVLGAWLYTRPIFLNICQ